MKPEETWIENAKKRAASEATKNIKDNFIIGLGSGSTVKYAIQEIGKKIKKEKLHILGVPSSYQTLRLAIKHGIPITTLEEHPFLDLTIDGADQIDNELNLIKGRGGAFTREKIIAFASKKLLIVADERKKVKVLGEKNQPVPIEVLDTFSGIIYSNSLSHMAFGCIQWGPSLSRSSSCTRVIILPTVR